MKKMLNDEGYVPKLAWPHYELLLRTETSSELKQFENRCVKNCWTLGELYDRVHQMTIPDNGPAADLGTLILGLGNSLYQSNDLPNHKFMALRAYAYASKYGNIDAMMKAGFMLEHGEEVKQSFETALKFYQKAADLGDTMAKELLKDLMERMDSDYIIIDEP